jgi:hypothetical protein
MTVYVDESIHAYGRMKMCHMASPDIDELHAMADHIGVARKWFQNPLTMPKVSRPHYDIAMSKRALAVAAGAKEVTGRQMVVISNVALNRLLKPRHAEGIGWPLDPLRLQRRYMSIDDISGWELWLEQELGPAAISRSRELAWENGARAIARAEAF